MSTSKPATRVVFVGNIPYDTTEDQLKEIFQQVGPIVNFRLLLDRETGKPKGYGFCEYRDADTAYSAMRNLNNYEVGGRNLRVDFADSDKIITPAESRKESTSSAHGQSHGKFPPGRQKQWTSYPVPQTIPPPGQNPPLSGPPVQHTQGAAASVRAVIENTSQEKLGEILASMKGLIQKHPDHAQKLLTSNPQLSFALIHSLITLNLVSPVTVQKMLPANQLSSIPSQQPPVQVGGSQSMQQYPPGQIPGPVSYPGDTMVPTHPQQQPMHPMPSMPQYQPPSQAIQSQLPAEMDIQQQAALLQQVMNLTPEQIELLPPVHRQQIYDLRNLLG